MAVTKRCIRCHKKVRPDGTCSNPECVLYVPEENTETTSKSSTDEETTAKTSKKKSK